MNTKKDKKTRLRIMTGVLIASLVIALIPLGSVRAENPNQEDNPIPQGVGGRGVAFLEKALQREQKASENLLNLFEKADKLITNLEDAIENGEANGKDVSAVEDTLAELNSQLASARSAHDEAASLLTSHAGFDDSGKVTDGKSALATIRMVGKHQREVRRLIGDSLKDALRAIRECRQDNQAE